jgi:hypothetical protein
VIISNDEVTYGPESLSYDETTEITTGTITEILPGEYDVEIFGYFDDGSTIERVLKGSATGIEVLEGNTTLVSINLWIIIDGGVVDLPEAGSVSITGTVENAEHTTTINAMEYHWISSVTFVEPDEMMPDDIGSTNWTSRVQFDHTIENVNPGDVLVFNINLIDPLTVSDNVPSYISMALGGSVGNILSLIPTTVSEFESTGTVNLAVNNTGFKGVSSTSLNGFWINLNTSENPSAGQTIESFTIGILVPETFTNGDPIPTGQDIKFSSLSWTTSLEGDLTEESFPLVF